MATSPWQIAAYNAPGLICLAWDMSTPRSAAIVKTTKVCLGMAVKGDYLGHTGDDAPHHLTLPNTFPPISINLRPVA